MAYQSRELGELGEEHACEKIVELGLRVLERNYRWKRVEIDIIAEEPITGRLHFIEVKTRLWSDPQAGLIAVDEAKQRRIMAAAGQYLFDKSHEKDFQFDIVVILADVHGHLAFKYYADAFGFDTQEDDLL